MPETPNGLKRRTCGGHRVAAMALAALSVAACVALGQQELVPRAKPKTELEASPKAKSVKAEAPALTPDNRTLIAELDSAELRVREEAMRKLRISPSLRLGQLENVLANEKLSTEQFTRVARIAKEQFERTPRAALGVQFDDAGARSSDGVPIARTIEGFDSCRVLKAGDVMYAMSGVRVTSLDDARKIITSHDPGERMTIHLFRNGEALIVRAGLGDYADLEGRPGRGGGGMGFAGNRGNRGFDVTAAAWELRLARVMGDRLEKTTPIDPGVEMMQYAAMEAELDHAVENAEKRDQVKTVARRDRGGAEEGEEHGIVAGGGASGRVGVEASAEFAGTGHISSQDEAVLVSQRNQLQLQLNELNMQMMQQAIDAKRRQVLMAQSMRIRTLIMEIDGKIAKEKMNRIGPKPVP